MKKIETTATFKRKSKPAGDPVLWQCSGNLWQYSGNLWQGSGNRPLVVLQGAQELSSVTQAGRDLLAAGTMERRWRDGGVDGEKGGWMDRE